MKKVQITETVLRDANQSLMATRLPYSDFAEILPEMNKAGYYSVECWGGATFDSCLRYLGEDPWQRLRDIRKAMPDTKLQMLLRGQNLLGYKHYHDDVVEKFVELSIKNGIDILRIFDALNDFRNTPPRWKPPRNTPPRTPLRPAASPIRRARSTRSRNMSRCVRSSRPWASTPSA